MWRGRRGAKALGRLDVEVCEMTTSIIHDCESNKVKLTHDAYENTWKCGELN